MRLGPKPELKRAYSSIIKDRVTPLTSRFAFPMSAPSGESIGRQEEVQNVSILLLYEEHLGIFTTPKFLAIMEENINE